MKYKFTLLCFLIAFTPVKLFSQCAGPQTYTVDPQPGPGNTYAAGQVVEFCYTVNGYTQTNEDWFHGLTFTFGPGWDQSTFTVISTATPATPSTGSSPDSPNVWGYFPNGIVSEATGTTYGPGFYYESGNGNDNSVYDGNPGDNYGDECATGNNCTWTFCFSIQVSSSAPAGTSVSLTATPSVDGQSGSYVDGIGYCDNDLGTSISTSTVGGVQVPVATATGTNITCHGTCDGTATVSVVSGTQPYRYLWSNSASTASINNLCAATYKCTVTDANNSTSTASYTVLPTVPLTVSTNITEPTCGTDGSITVDITSGNGPYYFSWNGAPPVNGDSIMNNLTPGPITVVVTDGNNCSLTVDTSIVGTPPISIQVSTFHNISCAGGSDGSITVNVTGGGGGYQYFWDDGDTNPTDSNLTAGTYNLEVFDINFCFADTDITLTEPATLLTINAPVIQNSACGGSGTGSIAANVTDGTPAYAYNWTEQPGGQTYTGQTINNLPAGTYNLTVTDNAGCIDSASYQVINPSPLVVSYDSTNVTCFGGSDGTAQAHVTSGTPPYLFSWDQNPATTSDSTISGLSEGPVDIYITDSNNCIVDRIINITQPTQVGTQLVSATNVTCFGAADGSITVSGTGGTPGTYTFNWGTVTGATNSPLAPGTYTVTATDVNGCTGTGQYSITQPNALQFNQPIINNIGCSGGNTGSITANVSQGTPAYTFNWQQQNGGATYTGQTISNLSVDVYAVTVTDANSCTADTSYSIIAIPQLAIVVTPASVSCYNGNNGGASVAVTSGTPPYQYSFNNGAYGINSSVSNQTAGNLQVNVTDANNCLADTTVLITQPQPININLVSPATNVLCNGGSNGELDVTATGGTQPYTFNWSNQFAGADNTNLTAGPYTVILVDFNDCADTMNYAITQPEALVANPTHINDLCYTGSDGSIDVNPSGGTPSYSFTWSNGETSEVATGLVQGLYSCTVTDSHNCSIVATDTVGQPSKIVLTQDSGIAVLCVGQDNGKLLVTAAGGTPPYIYNATQDNVNFVSTTDGVIVGLGVGNYNIQVADSQGCTKVFSGTVPPAIPDAFYAPVVDSTLCYGSDYNDGGVTIFDSTIQNAPYQYSIDGGTLQDTGYFQNLSAGPHTVTAVSNNGCITSIPVVVPQPLPIVAIVTPDTVTLPLGGSQAVQVTYLNATNPGFNWSPAMGLSCIDCPNPVANAYAPGTYTVTVSMVNGAATCYGSTTLTVNVLAHVKSFVPNAFSPNGDGNNDIFQVYGEDIKTVDLKVFNRWGELVYSTTNSLAGWDGTYKGALQMAGVYTYEVSITYLDDTKEFKRGSITMVR